MGTRNNNVGPVLYTNSSEQPNNTNQDIYVWNENSETIKKLLERNKEIENLICNVMSDYKAFKGKTIDQISKQNKINQELTKRIINYRYKQNQFNRKFSNRINTVQTEFTDELRQQHQNNIELNNRIDTVQVESTDELRQQHQINIELNNRIDTVQTEFTDELRQQHQNNIELNNRIDTVQIESTDELRQQYQINIELNNRIDTVQTEFTDELRQQHQNNIELNNRIDTVQIESTDELEKVKEQLYKLINNKSPLIGVLNTLTSNYPIKNIIVNGVSLHVSNLISITHNDVVYFKSNEKLKIIDGQRIDGIEL